MRLRSSRSSAESLAAWAIVGLLAAPLAHGTTFYKWVDKDGTVHYSDAAPKGVAGPVTQVEVDPDAHTAAPATLPTAPRAAVLPPVDTGNPPPTPDLLGQRRATRDRLEANLDRARERLDLAQKALATAGEPQPDEWQVTAGSPPGPGVARSNCHATPQGGTLCPGRVPSAAYYSRVQQLEDDVKRAQAMLDAAERAYRQGVD